MWDVADVMAVLDQHTDTVTPPHTRTGWASLTVAFAAGWATHAQLTGRH